VHLSLCGRRAVEGAVEVAVVPVVVAVVVVLLLATACDVDAAAGSVLELDDATIDAAALRGGTAIEPDSWLATIALGQLVDVDGALRCTAMAIAPRHVLTARHCVPSDQSLASLLDERTLGFVERNANVVLPVVSVQRHPSLDVAVLGLGQDVQGSPIVDVSSPRLTDVVTIAGAGLGTPSADDVLVGQFRIDALDVDSFTVSGVDGAGLCPGDSGGPILVEQGPSVALVGLHVRGFVDCSGPSTAVRADAFAAFLGPALAADVPDAEPCRHADADRCVGETLRRCVLGAWRTIDCTTVSHACVDGEEAPRCVPVPCGDVSAAGRCEGSVARACVGGTLWERDCAYEPDRGCALDTSTGRFGCVACDACDGVCIDLSADLEHCGLCDHGCAAAERCVAGACVAPPPRAEADEDLEPDSGAGDDEERAAAPVGCAGEASFLSGVFLLRRRRRGP
jgi:hypothetical protein